MLDEGSSPVTLCKYLAPSDINKDFLSLIVDKYELIKLEK